MIGQTLAHYKILEKIGSGGMGDVYLAEDTKLDRKVALKVLPPELAENELRLERFKREAKAIAALNHPNIVMVHSVEESDGLNFITMEFVRGRTLRELVPLNGLPLEQFFDIAIPLVDAVATAHKEGITHRDLKPENVMIDENGRVKVLDFGLAQSRPVLDADDNSPTRIRTQEGAIVGTVEYMSPEQAEGKPLDGRADIFSIGVIFYEMLTGRLPFAGESAVGVLSAILTANPPPVSNLRPELPASLSAVVERCLAKRPKDRYQQARDLKVNLKAVRNRPTPESTTDSAPTMSIKAGGKKLSCTLSLAIGVTSVLVLGIGLYIFSAGGSTERQAASQAAGRQALQNAVAKWTRLRNQPADASLTSQPSYQRALSEEAAAKQLESSGDLGAAARSYDTASSYLEAARRGYAEAQSQQGAASPPPATSSAPVTSTVPATSSAPTRDQEEAAIRQTLATYERAIESKDLSLFRQTKPNLTSDEAERLSVSFEAVDSHDVELDIRTVTIQGDSATAVANRSDTIVVRGRAQNGNSHQQTFVLEKVRGGWVIVQIR